ncbi:RDD family protein [Smaragdicoccus niigatensis]|uniref:RDD family protein n=1 Tax=Smaragdicoccus niigatensis TaxID=359359 RepID=UPI00037512E4|nr:RDD family protein [Smaragdicoccus niigatensis]
MTAGGNQPAPLELRPAALMHRFGARLLDGLIIAVPMWIVGLVLSLVLGTFGSVLWRLLLVAVSLGYFAYFESQYGQTLGKQILDMRVVGPTGASPTFQQSLRRNFFLAVMLLGVLTVFVWPFVDTAISIIEAVVYGWIGWTIHKSPTKQGFHDTFAGDFHVVKYA